MKNKKKKEKITYIDDGRTIADMSGVSGGRSHRKMQAKTKQKTVNGLTPLGTYLSAVKMMFVPMLFVLGFILVAYMIMSLIFLLV